MCDSNVDPDDLVSDSLVALVYNSVALKHEDKATAKTQANRLMWIIESRLESVDEFQLILKDLLHYIETGILVGELGG